VLSLSWNWRIPPTAPEAEGDSTRKAT